MQGKSVENAKAEYRSAFDSSVSRFINTMWGGHWHLGVFENAEESLLQAQLRANRLMADAAQHHTLFRVRRQFELARDGHLGWVFYAIQN